MHKLKKTGFLLARAPMTSVKSVHCKIIVMKILQSFTLILLYYGLTVVRVTPYSSILQFIPVAGDQPFIISLEFRWFRG